MRSQWRLPSSSTYLKEARLETIIVQAPAAQYFTKLLLSGRAVIFVSHDTEDIRQKLEQILASNTMVIVDVLRGETETIVWAPVGFNHLLFDADMAKAGFSKLPDRMGK